jgi:hypothetical protein
MFNVSEPKFSEVTNFVNKARAASAPGPNGIPYKVYKKCDALRKYLWRLLKVVWRKDSVPLSWSKAEGVYIPKEENSISNTLGQFRPISLLNVEGKIMFGILAERMSSFVLENGLINTYVQKAGIPGSPGCLEHASIIWHTIQECKKLRRNLSVVWLDLANAYGSVPHALIEFSYGVPVDPRKGEELFIAILQQLQHALYNCTVHHQLAELGGWNTNGLRNISNSVWRWKLSSEQQRRADQGSHFQAPKNYHQFEPLWMILLC